MNGQYIPGETVEQQNARYKNALRYIAGWDVPGYDAHLRPEAVAIAALGYDGNPAGLNDPDEAA